MFTLSANASTAATISTGAPIATVGRIAERRPRRVARCGRDAAVPALGGTTRGARATADPVGRIEKPSARDAPALIPCLRARGKPRISAGNPGCTNVRDRWDVGYGATVNAVRTETHGRWPWVAAAATLPVCAAAFDRPPLRPLAALLLHQTEEWVWPGSSLPWMNRTVLGSDDDEFPIDRRAPARARVPAPTAEPAQPAEPAVTSGGRDIDCAAMAARLENRDLDYHTEVRKDHEHVDVVVRLAHVGNTSLRMEHEVRLPDGSVAASGTTIVVAWDPVKRGKREITDAERAALTAAT
jgi:hypothetical protein